MLLTAEPVTVKAFSAADAARLSDDALLAEQRSFAAARRLVDAGAAAVSAEIARRSDRTLGYAGLAQSRGARTAEALVQQVTGFSAADARRLVSVGAMVAEPEPWLESVANAVTAGDLSLEAATAIRAGLGEAGRVSVEDLSSAADQLVEVAPSLSPERIGALARDARNALDLDGVPEREEDRRQRRYLRFSPLPDGNWRVDGILDPESMAIVGGGIDAITAPRRGGPRFYDSASEPARRAGDTRTIPQLMLDTLVDIVQFATRADAAATPKGAGTLFGKRRIAVRVHVSARDLHTGQGFAHIEGQTAAVSVATARRIACDAGIVPVLFDTDGHVINVGRDQRLHTVRQRIGLAARDGGCTVHTCERPPGWCEAHHIDEWDRDNGKTSIKRGILLCRHHHMLLHNHHWWITDDGHGLYTMHSPAGDTLALQSRNPIRARLGP